MNNYIFYEDSRHAISPNFSVNEDLQCDERGCKIRAEIDDYVRVERRLDFGIQVSDLHFFPVNSRKTVKSGSVSALVFLFLIPKGSNPPHDPFCHPNYNVCHNYSGKVIWNCFFPLLHSFVGTTGVLSSVNFNPLALSNHHSAHVYVLLKS